MPFGIGRALKGAAKIGIKSLIPGGGAIVTGLETGARVLKGRGGKSINNPVMINPQARIPIPGGSPQFGGGGATRSLLTPTLPGGNQMAGGILGGVLGTLVPGVTPGQGFAAGSAFGGLFDPKAQNPLSAIQGMPLVKQPLVVATNRAEPGYVLVRRTDPMTGQLVVAQVLKPIAQKFGLWKPAKKPIISISESNALRKSAAAERKLVRHTKRAGFICRPSKTGR
jgi:hypothetical protein